MGLVQPGLTKAEDKARVAAEIRQQDLDRMERVRERAKRSPQEQLKILDWRCGKDQGCVKERARLHAQIEAQKKSIPSPKSKGKKAKGRKAVAA